MSQIRSDLAPRRTPSQRRSKVRVEHILNATRDLLREQFYLALPMKPLCREECQGLCPQCGVNRNVEACQCSTRWDDPRLAALKALIPERKHDDA